MTLCKNVLSCLMLFILLLTVLSSCSNEDIKDNSINEKSDITSNVETSNNISEDTSAQKLEYTKQIKVTTDKDNYSFDDVVTFDIIAPDKDDILCYGYGYWIEYWSQENNNWIRCKKEYVITEEGIESKGIGTLSFVFSQRGDDGYSKYRIAIDVSIDGYNVSTTIYSNEFTVTK